MKNMADFVFFWNHESRVCQPNTIGRICGFIAIFVFYPLMPETTFP